MSRFITREDLERRWSSSRVARYGQQKAKLALDGEEPDEPAVEAAIAESIGNAESIAVSRLSLRYGTALPTAPGDTPDVLKGYVSDMAMYALTRHHQPQGDDIKQANADALAWMKDVAASRADLGLAGEPDIDNSSPQILMSKTKEDLVFEGPRGIDEW